MTDTGRKFGPFPVTDPITGKLKSSETLRHERMDAIRHIAGWKVIDTDVGEYMQHVFLRTQDDSRYLDVMLWRSGQFEGAKLRETHHTYGFVRLDRMEFSRVTLDGLICCCLALQSLDDDEWRPDPKCRVHRGDEAA